MLPGSQTKLGNVRPTKRGSVLWSLRAPSTSLKMMSFSPTSSLTSSINRCLAQDQTSDIALLAIPSAIAKCVQPFCTDSIGLEPDEQKSGQSLPARDYSQPHWGTTSISTTSRSSEGSKVIRNIVYQTLTEVISRKLCLPTSLTSRRT